MIVNIGKFQPNNKVIFRITSSFAIYITNGWQIEEFDISVCESSECRYKRMYNLYNLMELAYFKTSSARLS